MAERICVFPGSFDPVTTGHLDLICRALSQYDRVIVAVGVNPKKTGAFPVEERLALLRTALTGLQRVEVASYEGLTVDFALSRGACAMLRGVRTSADLEEELTLAALNRHLAPRLETVLLPAKPEFLAVSSSAVRELAANGASLAGFVPDALIPIVSRHFQP
ncbi:MAG: pantetheine-phosphate adenylyltransferase [Clostridia bacterium]|nr:pantetheine-phosphate adenylyltransferase [Clostridia bacterium]